MNKYFKSALALVLAVLMVFCTVSCAKHKKSDLDVEKFPFVFADDKGLKLLNEGEEEPTVLTEKFYTFLNSQRKVQAASNGKIYYIETENKTTTLGDLYAYDVAKKESTLIHSGVYSFKVSHDGSCIIISDGTGGIFKYDKKHEKKGDYSMIQSSGVSSVLDISADGKYVLYTQVLNATNYYTLTIAKTDFETNEKIDKLSVKERVANTSISKAPIIIAQNYKEYIGAADDLSIIYYSLNGEEDAVSLCAFKNYKENVTLCEKEYKTYFITEDGKLMFSTTEKGVKQLSDVITDKYASKDAKLKKKTASKKEWQAKVNRENIRNKVLTYLNNINTITFYSYSKSSKQVKSVLELSGQFVDKGTDAQMQKVFFGATIFDFSTAKKPDIMKVSVAYKLFDEIKSRTFSAVSFDGVENLSVSEKAEYNSGDCYVDVLKHQVNIIMDFDYLDKKVGTLYTVGYDKDGFADAKLISDKAAKVAHFSGGDDVYFVTQSGTLVQNDVKTAVMKNYAYSTAADTVKIAYTSTATDKKDDYGNVITVDTAYLIQDGKSIKLGTIFKNKDIVSKGNMLAFYTSFDFKNACGEMMLYNGEKLLKLGTKVAAVYTFA